MTPSARRRRASHAHPFRRPALCGLALGIVLLVGSIEARTLGGAEIPEQLVLRESTLLLNGAGVRHKYFVDVYVAGLYLEQRSSDAARIVAADAPMAMYSRHSLNSALG